MRDKNRGSRKDLKEKRKTEKTTINLSLTKKTINI